MMLFRRCISRTSIAIVLAAIAMVGCEPPIIDDWGTAGYAVVAGSLPDVLGRPARSRVFVSCGLHEPGEFGSSFDQEELGRYRAELMWPHAAGSERDSLAANDWKGICRIAAPAGAPPYAEAIDTVLFAPTRAERVVTTIDLVPVSD